MKIAIASTGNTLEDRISQQFARCDYFIIYDTDNKAIEIIPNAYKNEEERAGQLSVELIASRNVRKIISGDFGLKIKPYLDKLRIQMIVLKDNTKRIKDILEMLDK